jgi:hypothetical protein
MRKCNETQKKLALMDGSTQVVCSQSQHHRCQQQATAINSNDVRDAMHTRPWRAQNAHMPAPHAAAWSGPSWCNPSHVLLLLLRSLMLIYVH